MKTFQEFLTEDQDSSKNNEHFGKAYEIATALHVHHQTGAKNNTDPKYVHKMEALRMAGEESFHKLPPHLQERVSATAKASADAYLHSLKHNHKIDPQDITHIHHTSKGIGHLTGAPSDRIQNPHDIVVQTKQGQMHGASLKATSGTLSNNSVGAVDRTGEKTGIKTNLQDIWAAGKKKAGLENLSGKEVKERRDDPKVKQINRETQYKAAQHHVQAFNAGNVEEQRKHLMHLMKTDTPNIPYDYVNGTKGSATPSNELPHAKSIAKSKSFSASVSGEGGLVKIHDHAGNHLATIEHRPTHGAFSGIQANVKIGTIK